ncbi:diacylglycerol kinase zeta-like isoform X4 [Labeo rohita]|uniref:Diacylglycerol kinase zeta-like isoform X4 n=1 Tax=Labeo rohita TaxID=84645 RepID=A0A498N517_LABRO|nr:diacylglycerol kinase zeta-like isoform X4 [Labeo rohita]
MEQSNWQPEGEVEGLSRPLEALLDSEDPGGPDSASSSCSDLSITTPAAQPSPNNTKSFSGLRIFGRKWSSSTNFWNSKQALKITTVMLPCKDV